jgi:hypothetical protein
MSETYHALEISPYVLSGGPTSAPVQKGLKLPVLRHDELGYFADAPAGDSCACLTTGARGLAYKPDGGQKSLVRRTVAG